MMQAGLAQWQCSGFVIRSVPSRLIPINPEKWLIAWTFRAGDRPLSVLILPRAAASGSKSASKVRFRFPTFGGYLPAMIEPAAPARLGFRISAVEARMRPPLALGRIAHGEVPER